MGVVDREYIVHLGIPTLGSVADHTVRHFKSYMYKWIKEDYFVPFFSLLTPVVISEFIILI